MRNVYAITLVHCEPEVLAFSLGKALRTNDQHIPIELVNNWFVVPHHWPIDPVNFTWKTRVIGGLVDAAFLMPDRNRGGHGGLTWALEQFDWNDQDYILIYDPDSNPVSQNWIRAMIATLDEEPNLGYVSLLPEACVDRPWTFKNVAFHKVAFLDRPEMINVTLFRGAVLKNGIQSCRPSSPYYGHVEPWLSDHAQKLGYRNGYLYDFREARCPIPHPQVYTDWKYAHAFGGFSGNFSEYLKRNSS